MSDSEYMRVRVSVRKRGWVGEGEGERRETETDTEKDTEREIHIRSLSIPNMPEEIKTPPLLGKENKTTEIKRGRRNVTGSHRREQCFPFRSLFSKT